MKKFAVFDIDGTIIRSGLYREVVYAGLKTGVIPGSLQDSFSAHEKEWYSRKHIEAFRNYESAMVSSFDMILHTIKYQEFDELVKQVFKEVKDKVYVYTRDLAKDLKSKGYTLIAISGSQSEIVELFAKEYGFDIWVGQKYTRGSGGYFTGEIAKTHKNKDVLLKRIVEGNGLTFENSVGVGDSGGDIEMLSIVNQPIAFNPDVKLLASAKQNGWKIVVERKSIAYTLEKGKDGSYILA